VESLARRAWQLHALARQRRLAALVEPSCPILYFGNTQRYGDSPLRVATVGLNPSLAEFPSNDPYQRFPATAAIHGSLDAGMLSGYTKALDDYFRIAPYKGWFNPSFEQMLRGLGASFYDDAAPSTAVHTDLCSPLATNPTWTGLVPSDQATLQAEGVELWHELIERLQPDVLLVSIRREYLRLIRFPVIRQLGHIITVERDNPYTIEAWRTRLGSGNEPLVVFGQAAQKPFGLIGGVDQRRVGEHLRTVLDAG